MRLTDRILHRLRGQFYRNVATAAGFTVLAQVATFAFAPVITRLYGPEAFGTQSLFVALVSFLATVAALCYPIAVVLPAGPREAWGLVRLSMHVAVVFCVLLAILLAFVGEALLAVLNAQAIGAFVYLIPLAVMVSVAAAGLEHWLVRKQAFALQGRSVLVQTVLNNVFKVGLGLFSPTAFVLILTNTASALIAPALIWRSICHEARALAGGSGRRERLGELLVLARRYRDFPLLRAPQAVINGASHALPLILLAAYAGPSAAGFYALATAVLVLPENLIGQSFAQVFYPHVNDAARRGDDLPRVILRATGELAAIGAVPFALVALAGPFLYAFVFGEAWRAAGEYAQWLSLWLFFQFINRPAVAAVPVLGIQRGLLVYECFSAGSKLLALYLGFVVFGSATAAVAVFSVFGAIAYVFLIAWVVAQARRTPSPPGGQDDDAA